MSTTTYPHPAGRILPDGIADGPVRKALFFPIAAKGGTVEADEIVEPEPEAAFGVLGDAPTLFVQVTGGRPFVVPKVERNQVVEPGAIEISQGALATKPRTALPVFVNELHGSACNPLVLQMVEIRSVVPADPTKRTEP